MLTLQKNDRLARILILTVSFVVFAVVVLLDRFKLQVNLGFDVHVFAAANAIINSIVAVLLLAALIAIKNKNVQVHKTLMLTAILFSVLFLVTYISHHLLAGNTAFGDANHDGILSIDEKEAVGGLRTLYVVLLLTHIFLAAIILPFILFTAYRALIGEYDKHKKLARITWPIWFYVAVTGPVVYLLISPYYSH